MIRLPISLAALCLTMSAFAAEPFDDKFRQLDELLPTPTTIRTASGAPGHAYWQQRADYAIRATLDEPNRAIHAAGTITYHNNSPDTLSYLWLQLDQNLFTPGSDNRTASTVLSREAWSKGRSEEDGVRFDAMRSMLESRTFEGGFNITSI